MGRQRAFLVGMAICVMVFACPASAQPDPAAALRAKYTALTEQLQQNQFKQPLVLASVETQHGLQGDIYAVVAYPFGVVRDGLDNPQHWCEAMILHINTKYCHALSTPSGTILRVNIGRKTPEELADAVRVEFAYSLATTTPDYIEIKLSAKEGPLGTSDYRILLEAVALPGGKSFVHLIYAYTMNFAARAAMQMYLGTIGSSKVGFTVVGTSGAGHPDYIDGVRGLVERNTMRYYLAIDAYLGAVLATPAAQSEQRLQNWFAATELYPQQLYEMERGEYLEMKRAEVLRQQTLR